MTTLTTASSLASQTSLSLFLKGTKDSTAIENEDFESLDNRADNSVAVRGDVDAIGIHDDVDEDEDMVDDGSEDGYSTSEEEDNAVLGSGTKKDFIKAQVDEF